MTSVSVVPYQQYIWTSADDKDVEWHGEWELVGEDFTVVNQEEEEVLVYEVQSFTWMKPPASHVKINCDASLAKKGVGCGYIMRDDEGCVIFGEAIKLDGVKTVVAAELAAIHLACFRAQDFGMKFVWLESDSLTAVNLINGIFAASLEDRDILRKIDSIASSFEGWTVSHVRREANRVADKLAKMGGSGNEVIFMEDDMPVGISSIVDEDRLGKIYTRVKNLGSLSRCHVH